MLTNVLRPRLTSRSSGQTWSSTKSTDTPSASATSDLVRARRGTPTSSATREWIAAGGRALRVAEHSPLACALFASLQGLNDSRRADSGSPAYFADSLL